MNRWERPHGTDGTMVVSGFIVALSVLGLAAATWWLLLPPADWTPRRAVGLLGVYAFLLVWLVIGWRDNRAGVFVADSGVLVRTLRHSRYLPWAEVAGFESRPAEVLGRATVREAIWVVTRTGEAVETPVQKDSGYRRGHAKNRGRILGTEEYAEAIQRLWQRLHARAIDPHSTDPPTADPPTTAEPPAGHPQ